MIGFLTLAPSLYPSPNSYLSNYWNLLCFDNIRSGKRHDAPRAPPNLKDEDDSPNARAISNAVQCCSLASFSFPRLICVNSTAISLSTIYVLESFVFNVLPNYVEALL
ncbi:hypothetical protein Nepgr_000464 [Nepenthes gracilis]|uniref:Uncharacterized protein n=1 Tax=Nepenthes gracilis TaxID=150966 RepID=A0AAD3RWT1_NEPGR|nr:hypothetical protein Nepgr_000464 [Nepenthes gracilis]